MKGTLFVLMIFMLMTAACQSAQTDPIALTAEDAGKTIELKKEDSFEVSLEGNPTTGYNWYMVTQEPAILEQVGQPAFKADSNKLGSPGIITLKFKAIATGKGALHLVYKRSWETGVAALNTFEVILVVN